MSRASVVWYLTWCYRTTPPHPCVGGTYVCVMAGPLQCMPLNPALMSSLLQIWHPVYSLTMPSTQSVESTMCSQQFVEAESEFGNSEHSFHSLSLPSSSISHLQVTQKCLSLSLPLSPLSSLPFPLLILLLHFFILPHLSTSLPKVCR